MSKKVATKKTASTVSGYKFVCQADGIEEHELKTNGLRVLYKHIPDTGVVTTNITYLVGARDEARGETGLAHMLEHMLFKPTSFDKKNGIKEGYAMKFERETGCALNATTDKDRTNYYFGFPKEHFKTALKIEAERMTGAIIDQKELTPERGNVLSEFDMNNGDPHFALEVQMCSTAFHSHPYGHETIGYREDIEDYNPNKLANFYENYYRPDNAVMIVIGDIDKKNALEEVKKKFSSIKKPDHPIPRFSIKEPKQEGLRRIEVKRPGTINLIGLGFKKPGFPGKEWFTTTVMLEVLTQGPDSILHKLLVDTNKASSMAAYNEAHSETGLADIFITLAGKQKHVEIEKLVLDKIKTLKSKDIAPLVKKAKANILTSELFSRQSSMAIAAELNEYVASGNWTSYAETPQILKNITNQDVMDCLEKSFAGTNMTIGYFIAEK